MELDYALVRQKDKLLQLINDEKYEEAFSILEFVKDLWESCSYGYKYLEVKHRIVLCLESEVLTSSHWKTELKWVTLLNRVRGN